MVDVPGAPCNDHKVPMVPGLMAVRQPRVGELVADALRQRILSGEFPDGEALPTQPELKEAFRVSMPSVREALRMLEAEGLVVMRRGASPGAVVRLPDAENLAYMLGLVLGAQATSVAELRDAVTQFEPGCAGLCALRPDRAEVVVPILEELQRQAEDERDDQDAFARHVRGFHEAMVANCGNRAIRVMLGSLEVLWSSHVQAGVRRLQAPEPDVHASYTSAQSLEAHAELLSAIVDGDAPRAVSLARRHAHELSCELLPITAAAQDGAGVVRPDLLTATGRMGPSHHNGMGPYRHTGAGSGW